MMLCHKIALDEQPCSVVYVDQWKKFLVGTYMLDTSLSACNAQNNRKGSLLLFELSHVDQQYNLIDRYECPDGGVFDLAVHDELIFVAHANNAIGTYRFHAEMDKDDLSETGTPRSKHISTISTKSLSSDFTILLTSIDICHVANRTPVGSELFGAVGDSDGRVSVLSLGKLPGDMPKILDKTFMMQDYEAKAPVWQVRFVQPTEVEMQSELDRLYLIACCENGTWIVFHYYLNEKWIRLIHRFKDHSVGVTSVCILSPPEGPSPVKYREQSFDVIIGSYDETVRKYRLTIKKYSEERWEFVVDSTKGEKIRIDGAGVWRLMLKKDMLYMANMYAGCHKASVQDIASTMVDLTGCILSGVKSDEPALFYGIDVTPDGVGCVIDFNNKLVIFCKL